MEPFPSRGLRKMAQIENKTTWGQCRRGKMSQYESIRTLRNIWNLAGTLSPTLSSNLPYVSHAARGCFRTAHVQPKLDYHCQPINLAKINNNYYAQRFQAIEALPEKKNLINILTRKSWMYFQSCKIETLLTPYRGRLVLGVLRNPFFLIRFTPVETWISVNSRLLIYTSSNIH